MPTPSASTGGRFFHRLLERPHATLAVTLAAGLALRLFHLRADSLWLDEAFSVLTATRPIGEILAATAKDVHPPLYYLTLHYWTFLAGSSEAGARLLSVLFSLGVVASGYQMARRLFDEPTALVAAALLAFSPFQIAFAQEARMYALLALLATWSMLAWQALVERATPVRWGVYVVATSLMTYTHAYGLFVIVAQAASLGWLALRRHPSASSAIRSWIFAQTTIVILFVPWLATLVTQVAAVQQGFWIPPNPWYLIVWPIATYGGSIPLGVLLAAPLALGLGALVTRRNDATTRAASEAVAVAPAVVLLPWLAAPIVLPFILSKIGTPIFLPKYTIAASVPYAIVAARGLVLLMQHRTAATRWFLRLTAAVFAGSLVYYYAVPHKDDWRRAAAELQRLAEPKDVVVFYWWFNQVPFDYYRTRTDLLERSLPFDPAGMPTDDLAAEVAHDAGAHRRVWLAVLHAEPVGIRIADAYRRTFTERRHISAFQVDAYLFERR